MALHYIENPILFVGSTDSSIPKGRNERLKSRTREASARQALVTPENTHFEVLNFRKRRRRNRPSPKHCALSHHTDYGNPVTLMTPPSQGITGSMQTLQPSLVFPYTWPLAMDPLKILALATFHIRRISTMFLRKNPDRLSDVLRCRQWSYVSMGLDRVGQSACLDTALRTMGSKLYHMTGGSTSHYSVLSNYTSALRTLRGALNEPEMHKNSDIPLASQLLAIYEMLESLDNTAWSQHLAGARILSWPKVATDSANSVGQAYYSLPLLPMVTDALYGYQLCKPFCAWADAKTRLSGNGNFVGCHISQDPLRVVIDDLQGCKELSPSLSNVIELLIDAKLCPVSANVDSRARYALLDRAHDSKARLRDELLNSNLYSHIGRDRNESVDRLGLYLTALVSLDRLIESLRPVQIRPRDSSEDETGELCAQLLHLELKAADAYPTNDLLSAFELSAL